jgi:hypothetical protein
MQPGYPGSGQDPYGQQPPYTDPYAQPQYPPQQQPPADPTAQSQEQQPQQPPQPPADPAAQQPQQPQHQDPQHLDPYAQPTSGSPYPTSGPGYPPDAPYPVPGYGAPMAPPPQQNNNLGLTAMILGIISIPFAACCAFVGFFLGVAGLVLGILGMKKAGAGEANNRGQALTGVICGAIGLVLSIGSVIAVLTLNLPNFPTSP